MMSKSVHFDDFLLGNENDKNSNSSKSISWESKVSGSYCFMFDRFCVIHQIPADLILSWKI